jgi:hypothetical protein
VGKTNTIELNGKKYDALSGVLLADKAAAKPSAPVKSTGHFVDGIVRGQGAHAKALHHKPLASTQAGRPKLQPLTSKPKAAADIMPPKHAQRNVQHVKPHAPQHAQTLVRSAVSKPAPSLKRQLKKQTPTEALVKAPSISLEPKKSFYPVDAKRQKRAEQIAKSKLVSRFSEPSAITHLPKHKPAAHHATPLAHHEITQISKPIAQPSLDIFEKAIENATSHMQPHHPKLRRRFKNKHVNFAAGAFAVLLLFGFIAWQNIPNMKMRVASAKAGFHAQLPGYRPGGFAFGNVKYSTGSVAVNYNSNSDDRSISIVQQLSDWDSKSLLNNYVATTSPDYQAYQEGGRTIYIFGNNATWVDGGIWFKVNGSTGMSAQQLLHMASTM